MHLIGMVQRCTKVVAASSLPVGARQCAVLHVRVVSVHPSVAIHRRSNVFSCEAVAVVLVHESVSHGAGADEQDSVDATPALYEWPMARNKFPCHLVIFLVHMPARTVATLLIDHGAARKPTAALLCGCMWQILQRHQVLPSKSPCATEAWEPP